MLKTLGITAAVMLAAMAILTTACGDDDDEPAPETVYLWYNDVYGVVEYEADGDYPPPFEHDNLSDENIVVTLFFGETMDIYRENDVYGYCISWDDNTAESNNVNYQFPFVPGGRYWLNAEFTIMDSCFYAETEKFTHPDTSHTFVELRPTFLGIDRNCWSVGLASADDQEMVQVSERAWVTRKVYETYYKPRIESGELELTVP